jgi:predicted ATPase
MKMIKRFVIKKLFGFRNVDIKFKDNIKILVGENGLGKTTILNALYFLLSQKYNKLVQIEFNEMLLEFNNKTKINFTKDELKSFLHYQERSPHSNLRMRIKNSIDIFELKNKIDTLDKEDDIGRTIEEYVKNNERLRRYAPFNITVREIFALLSEPDINKFIQISNDLKNNVGDILYFPTYRRVEEELQNLGELKRFHSQREFFEEYEEVEIEDEDTTDSDDVLIHFGMEDVEKRIRRIESEIKKSSIIGFSRVTAEMLSQLLKGFPDVKDKDIKALDINTVRIVVHRVGEYLSQKDKEHILDLLDHIDKLRQKKELVYFIIKLIDIYNSHKHLDDGIKNFKEVCNKYLVDKEFRYNESAVELNIYRTKTNDIVQLNKLSSGEKQIVSLFSKLYFENYKNLIVLFDEPELSLSIKWQADLLPDIIKSKKCNFLLTVTHSPFIFKNELDKYAVGMNLYIK